MIHNLIIHFWPTMLSVAGHVVTARLVATGAAVSWTIPPQTRNRRLKLRCVTTSITPQ